MRMMIDNNINIELKRKLIKKRPFYMPHQQTKKILMGMMMVLMMKMRSIIPTFRITSTTLGHGQAIPVYIAKLSYALDCKNGCATSSTLEASEGMQSKYTQSL